MRSSQDEILDIDGENDDDDDDLDSKPRAVNLAANPAANTTAEAKTESDCGPSELKRQKTEEKNIEELNSGLNQVEVDDNLGSSGMKIEDLRNMKISKLKNICKENAIDVSDCVEKKELVLRIVNSGTVLIADF
ncbi:hypothetical protein TL16_g07681 [Triparma laevis f. inornata]|uniref:Uncharacterized protein n=1 Tax=Triparma laevis f. inornata TaxID=1714386 RepID=A0A9W7B036_9STRA|nr:hypothetical protein TL16_g07681 [Triparma laevis f. inornata]